MYSVDFEDQHTLRRVIITIYSEDETSMTRIDKSSYGLGRFLQFEETLMDRR